MKKYLFFLNLSVFIYSIPTFSASTALHNLSMTINPTSNLTVSGNPGTFSVSLDAAGTGSVTDNKTTYTVVSNTGGSGSLVITGAITTGGDMPNNTSLSASLASKKGSSAGAQALSTKAVNLVTKLPTMVSDTAVITYVFKVNNGWSVAAQNITRTVTFTLTSGS